jgi:hypothetical protein
MFPKEITEFEIQEFFTLSAEDLRAIRVDSNKKSRLALALQVGFLRMTGAALDTYEYIPRAVLECVAKQLHVPAPMLATMRALSRRSMTRHRHRSWACRYLGISRLKAANEQALFCALTDDVGDRRSRATDHTGTRDVLEPSMAHSSQTRGRAESARSNASR